MALTNTVPFWGLFFPHSVASFPNRDHQLPRRKPSTATPSRWLFGDNRMPMRLLDGAGECFYIGCRDQAYEADVSPAWIGHGG